MTGEKRWLALIVLCAGMLMIVLDATIVNVALPSIQRDLGFSQSTLAWVVNAYLIAFGGLLLLAGRLGDLVGRRRVFLIGLVLFTAASLVCGASSGQTMLVAARFVQGVGGAFTSSVILGMIVTSFPEPREQAKAIGVFSFVTSAGASIGLLLGGVLTQTLNWHWIFFVNLPIGVAVVALALRLVDADRGLGLRSGADAPGSALVTAALMLLVYAIVGATDAGWASTRTVAIGGLSALLLGAFVIRQSRAARPLLPLRVFRSRTVSGANLTQGLAIAGLFGVFFLGALYMQRVLGYSALEVGLAFLPTALFMGVLSLGLTARLTIRFGPRALLLPGLLACVAALLLLARAPEHGTYLVDLMPSMLLMGLGAGLSFPALMMLAMSDASPEDAGLASGLLNTTVQVGAALGLSILATLSTSRTNALLAAGSDVTPALVGGFRLGYVVATFLAAAAVAIAVTVLRTPAALPAVATDDAVVLEADAA